jgi:hypothetical protein
MYLYIFIIKFISLHMWIMLCAHFSCGMEAAPFCPCGAGRMVILMARTKSNYGRRFYRCPQWKVHVELYMCFSFSGQLTCMCLPLVCVYHLMFN